MLAVNMHGEYAIPGAGSPGRFGYTGHAYLPQVGLYHYKARMHSPALGRFMQTDPVGYAGGMNLYDYVSGDPVNGNALAPLDRRCRRTRRLLSMVSS